MRGVSKKMFISILTSVIVMVTMVATTFAWVGIFTYANTDIFQFNLKVQDLDVNYYLTISPGGYKNTFADEIDLNEIQKKVLLNQHINKPDYESYYSYINSLSADAIKLAFSKNNHITPSTTSITDNKLEDFKSINLSNTSYFQYINANVPYFKYDLYLSVGAREGIQDTSNFDLNVYLTDLENTLIGTNSTYSFYNRNPFRNLPSPNEFLLSIPDDKAFSINSANSARFALCLYEPINIDDEYENSSPIKSYIYHGGEKNPTIYNNIYDLGGNLPEDSNTALQELLLLRPNYKNSIYANYNNDYEEALQKAILRNDSDLDLIEENSKIWDSPIIPTIELDSNGNYKYNYLGVKDGIQTKMKVEVYFWFEGWDADCLTGIENMPVTLNLTFTGGNEE